MDAQLPRSDRPGNRPAMSWKPELEELSRRAELARDG